MRGQVETGVSQRKRVRSLEAIPRKYPRDSGWSQRGVYGIPEANHRRGQWHPTPVLLPGKSHGRRSLVGCSPWGLKESDTTERLHFHFSPSCTGEGNGNPLQGSCLENPRDGGAWWAAISGVAQSQTRLKQLSSSSCSMTISRSTQAASNDLISFFFMTESYSLESYSHYVTVWSLSL